MNRSALVVGIVSASLMHSWRRQRRDRDRRRQQPVRRPSRPAPARSTTCAGRGLSDDDHRRGRRRSHAEEGLRGGRRRCALRRDQLDRGADWATRTTARTPSSRAGSKLWGGAGDDDDQRQRLRHRRRGLRRSGNDTITAYGGRAARSPTAGRATTRSTRAASRATRPPSAAPGTTSSAIHRAGRRRHHPGRHRVTTSSRRRRCATPAPIDGGTGDDILVVDGPDRMFGATGATTASRSPRVTATRRSSPGRRTTRSTPARAVTSSTSRTAGPTA